MALDPVLERRLRWPLRLTFAGLWAERITRAFWPLWSLAFVAMAAMAFRLDRALTVEAWWFGGLALGAAILAALVHALRRFRRPLRAEALARMDALLPGQPLAALTDDQALGLEDAASRAIWAAHRARMARQAAGAQAVEPDLRLSRADPYALRYVAVTALVMAGLFGALGRVVGVDVPLGDGGGAAVAEGPAWEGWAEPPLYTAKPRLYLNDQPEGLLALPAGTKLTLRLYGEPGDLILSETLSARTEAPPASSPEQAFEVVQSGRLAIEGPGGREWQVEVAPDQPPTITLTGEVGRKADGSFTQKFAAKDDYGVTSGQVTFALDLGAIDRRFGLTIEPEALPEASLDLPMPIRGGRKEFTETLKDNLSEDLLANLPVTMTASVTDGAGQVSAAAVQAITLPGRRFFDPLAAAVVELRRDLMWNRANAARVVQVFKAITHHPEDLIRNQRAYLRLRVLIRELDGTSASLSTEDRDLMVDELWAIALLIEEGDLTSARERLERAQDRLSEAIKRGASQEEIQELMDEMRQALDNYMRELAETQEEQGQENAQNGPSMSMSQDQLQQMLDKLQQLMEEGKTAEAAELMEQLRQFMENMQMAEGQGTGGGGPGGQAMRDLQDTLRDQQGLADDAFRDMQRGQNGEEGEPQDGQDGEGEGEGDLSERQRELADRLGDLERNGNLPGAGTEEGREGRDRLGDAGEAMREAERALREGDLPGALDRQAEALEAMRDGLQRFGEAMADAERRQTEGGPNGLAEVDPNQPGLDPLGRQPGDARKIGSDENLLQGEDVYRRAEELLGEIRRRAGEAGRSDAEKGYLGRLLDLF